MLRTILKGRYNGSVHPERRYAEWRLVAIRRVPAQWIGFGIGFLVAAPCLLFLRRGGYIWALLGAFIANWTTGRISQRRTETLRDDPEGDDFGVSLSLRREVLYGNDEGLLSFADGWMIYTGRQCAFSVRRSDVLGVIADSKRHGFQFRGPAGRCTVYFVASENGRLGGAFKAWSEATDVPGTPIFPPVVPNEEAKLLFRWWPVFGILGATFMMLYAGRQKHLYEQWFIGAMGLIATAGVFYYGHLGRQALERIARGLPFLKSRLSKFLLIRLIRDPSATYRSYSIKAALERTLSVGPVLSSSAEASPQKDEERDELPVRNP
jgi:hypothetical protein